MSLEALFIHDNLTDIASDGIFVRDLNSRIIHKM